LESIDKTKNKKLLRNKDKCISEAHLAFKGIKKGMTTQTYKVITYLNIVEISFNVMHWKSARLPPKRCRRNQSHVILYIQARLSDSSRGNSNERLKYRK
jgi:hypothetical protein